MKILRARMVTPEEATKHAWVMVCDSPKEDGFDVRKNTFLAVLEFYDTETGKATLVGLTSGEG